jgi:hypothetical protein
MANTMQALPEEWLPASGVRALVDGLRATRPRLHTGRPTPAPGGLPSAPRLSGLGGPTPMAGRGHGSTQPARDWRRGELPRLPLGERLRCRIQEMHGGAG